MEQIRKCLSLLDADGRRRLRWLGVQIFVSSILEMFSVSMILPFLALMAKPRLITTSRYIHTIFAAADFRTSHQFLIAMGLFLLFLVIGKNVFLHFVTKAQAHFCHQQAARISADLLAIYLYAPFKIHLSRNSAGLIHIADHATDQSFAQVMMPFLIFMTEASTMGAILLLLLLVEPQLTLALGLLIIVCSIVLIWLLRSQLSHLGVRASALRILRLKTLQQSLHSVKEIKVFGREQFFLSIFRRSRYEHAEIQTRADTLAQTPRQVLEIVIIGGLLLAVLIVLLQGRATDDVIKTLGLFAMAAFRIMPGANRMVTAYNTIKHGTAYLNDTTRDYFDESFRSNRRNELIPGITKLQTLSFKNVSFQYDGAGVLALKNLSFSIRRGEVVGLVGASGAGKSTLVDVMLGLLQPKTGKILLDEYDTTGLPQVWSKIAGYVPQSVSLIDDTLRNNVAFGIEPSQIDDDRVWATLKRANLLEFSKALPDGLDTQIGERGVRMSGGQRQRIGIARALYNDPEILVFDEATAALDNESEHEITRAIEDLYGRKTIIIIAHRLSTVQKCDRLFLMKQGQIIATGSFDSLMSSSPEFANMVKLAELTSNTKQYLALQ